MKRSIFDSVAFVVRCLMGASTTVMVTIMVYQMACIDYDIMMHKTIVIVSICIFMIVGLSIAYAIYYEYMYDKVDKQYSKLEIEYLLLKAGCDNAKENNKEKDMEK